MVHHTYNDGLAMGSATIAPISNADPANHIITVCNTADGPTIEAREVKGLTTDIETILCQQAHDIDAVIAEGLGCENDTLTNVLKTSLSDALGEQRQTESDFEEGKWKRDDDVGNEIDDTIETRQESRFNNICYESVYWNLVTNLCHYGGSSTDEIDVLTKCPSNGKVFQQEETELSIEKRQANDNDDIVETFIALKDTMREMDSIMNNILEGETMILNEDDGMEEELRALPYSEEILRQELQALSQVVTLSTSTLEGAVEETKEAFDEYQQDRQAYESLENSITPKTSNMVADCMNSKAVDPLGLLHLDEWGCSKGWAGVDCMDSDGVDTLGLSKLDDCGCKSGGSVHMLLVEGSDHSFPSNLFYTDDLWTSEKTDEVEANSDKFPTSLFSRDALWPSEQAKVADPNHTEAVPSNKLTHVYTTFNNDIRRRKPAGEKLCGSTQQESYPTGDVSHRNSNPPPIYPLRTPVCAVGPCQKSDKADIPALMANRETPYTRPGFLDFGKSKRTQQEQSSTLVKKSNSDASRPMTPLEYELQFTRTDSLISNLTVSDAELSEKADLKGPTYSIEHIPSLDKNHSMLGIARAISDELWDGMAREFDEFKDELMKVCDTSVVSSLKVDQLRWDSVSEEALNEQKPEILAPIDHVLPSPDVQSPGIPNAQKPEEATFSKSLKPTTDLIQQWKRPWNYDRQQFRASQDLFPMETLATKPTEETSVTPSADISLDQKDYRQSFEEAVNIIMGTRAPQWRPAKEGRSGFTRGGFSSTWFHRLSESVKHRVKVSRRERVPLQSSDITGPLRLDGCVSFPSPRNKAGKGLFEASDLAPIASWPPR